MSTRNTILLAALMAVVACTMVVADQTIDIDGNSNEGTINDVWSYARVYYGSGSASGCTTFSWEDNWFKNRMPYVDWLMVGKMTGGLWDQTNDWIKDDGAGGNYYDFRGLKDALDKILTTGCMPNIVEGGTPKELAGDKCYDGAGAFSYGNVLAPTSMSTYGDYVKDCVNQIELYVSEYNTAHSTNHDVDDWRWRCRAEQHNPDWWYIEAPCPRKEWTGPGDWEQYYVANDNRDAYCSLYEEVVDGIADALDGEGNITCIWAGNPGKDSWGDYVPEYCADNDVKMDVRSLSGY